MGRLGRSGTSDPTRSILTQLLLSQISNPQPAIHIVSPYSFFAFTVLRRYEQHASWKHISVEYIPILLGGIMGATNNQPPATLPARGKQMARDTVRTVGLGKEDFGGAWERDEID